MQNHIINSTLNDVVSETSVTWSHFLIKYLVFSIAVLILDRLQWLCFKFFIVNVCQYHLRCLLFKAHWRTSIFYRTFHYSTDISVLNVGWLMYHVTFAGRLSHTISIKFDLLLGKMLTLSIRQEPTSHIIRIVDWSLVYYWVTVFIFGVLHNSRFAIVVQLWLP